MLEQNRLVRVNLLGFDPAAAMDLTKICADRRGVSVTAREHIGGWSALEAPLNQAALEFAEEVCALFAPKAFVGEPFKRAIDLLKRRGETISFAESCTGGLLAAHLTAIAGSSEVFEGSFVTYSNRLKSRWLGVQPQTLAAFGAVSEECVVQMASGAIAQSGADYALAISGIAGPSGGSAGKPVGTVFVGYANKRGETYAEALRLNGSRSLVRKQAVFHALRLLLTRLS
ncbi:MAG: CinA family protein [Helicobacteraceae bacterium]|jgi:nicotinamide-nucleotide amidase|nr:CinA family protein [Helicobacteraceae bacterium]